MSGQHVVIVGASLAGVRTAESLRAAGFTGTVTLVGEESASPYDRPPLSKQVLAGAWDTDRILLRRSPEEYTQSLGLTMRQGERAAALSLANRTVSLDSGEEIGFDGLVIATGARPRWLPGTESQPRVHVLRTLDDSLRLREAFRAGGRVVVVGGGFIGSEVAATAHGYGLDVTVLEGLPVPYERQLGMQMATVCAGLHARHGVPLRTGVAVAEVTEAGVTLADGELVPADVIVVGIGVVPNTEWLWQSGVMVGNGVECEDTCRVLDSDGVGVRGVVAVGDVACWPNPMFPAPEDHTRPERMRVEHWTNAAEMAAHAAATLASDLGVNDTPPEPFAPIPYFWSDQYDAKIQFLGRASAAEEVRVIDESPEEGRLVALYRAGDRLVGALGITRMRQVVAYRRLLGERASWSRALEHAGVS